MLCHVSRVNEPSTSNVDYPNKNDRTSETLLAHDNNTVLLSAAIILVKDALENFQLVRAIIDRGSQTNVITKKHAGCLGLTQNKLNISISEISSFNSHSNHAFFSTHPHFKFLLL